MGRKVGLRLATRSGYDPERMPSPGMLQVPPLAHQENRMIARRAARRITFERPGSIRPGVFALLTLLVALLIGACDRAYLENDEPAEITLLVAYTPAVADGAGDVAFVVEQALRETNTVYENSMINIRLQLAHLTDVEYETSNRLVDLRRLVVNGDGFMDDVHVLRDDHEADVVVLLARDRSATINAAVLAEERTAFAVVFWETLGAPDFGLAHELGHLQGARHTPDRDPNNLPYPYVHAYRNDTVKTIMATGPQQVLPYFSGPDQVYEGVVLGDSTLRNAARILRETAIYVANFRGRQRPTDFVPPGTWPTIDFQ